MTKPLTKSQIALLKTWEAPIWVDDGEVFLAVPTEGRSLTAGMTARDIDYDATEEALHMVMSLLSERGEFTALSCGWGGFMIRRGTSLTANSDWNDVSSPHHW